MNWGKSKSYFTFITLLPIIVLLIIYVFPIYWLIVTSFKTLPEMMSSRPTFIPIVPTLENYIHVIISSKFPIFLLNSFFIGITSTLITVLLAIGSSFSLSRLRFPFKRIFSLLILLVYLFPGILLVIPLFTVMSKIGLYDSRWSVILTHVILGLPFSIWTLTSFMDGVPLDLDDSARIDGCSRLGLIGNIYLPLILPGLATIIIFCFVVSWNDYLFPQIFLSSPFVQTIPVGIAGWTSAYSINWGDIAAASVLTIIPVAILFIRLGSFFVSGLTSGAIKG